MCIQEHLANDLLIQFQHAQTSNWWTNTPTSQPSLISTPNKHTIEIQTWKVHENYTKEGRETAAKPHKALRTNQTKKSKEHIHQNCIVMAKVLELGWCDQHTETRAPTWTEWPLREDMTYHVQILKTRGLTGKRSKKEIMKHIARRKTRGNSQRQTTTSSTRERPWEEEDMEESL